MNKLYLSMQIKKDLALNIQQCNFLRIISPWVKHESFRWLLDLAKPQNLQLITRFDKESIMSGRSDFSVFKLIDKTDNFEVRIDNFIHSKIYIFDDAYLYIGSANLTNAGFGFPTYINKEAGIFTNDNDLIEQTISYFNELWNNSRVLSKEQLEFGEAIANASIQDLYKYYNKITYITSLLPDLKWYEVLAFVIYLSGNPKSNYCVHLSEIYYHPIVLNYLNFKNNPTYTNTIRRTLQSYNVSLELKTEKLKPSYFTYCGNGYYGLSELGLKYVRKVLKSI